MTIDEHPLRYSTLVRTIESVLLTRLHNKRLDGYTLETAIQIVDSIVGTPAQSRSEQKGNDDGRHQG